MTHGDVLNRAHCRLSVLDTADQSGQALATSQRSRSQLFALTARVARACLVSAHTPYDVPSRKDGSLSRGIRATLGSIDDLTILQVAKRTENSSGALFAQTGATVSQVISSLEASKSP